MEQLGNVVSSWQQPTTYACWSFFFFFPCLPFIALLQGSAVAASIGPIEFEFDS